MQGRKESGALTGHNTSGLPAGLKGRFGFRLAATSFVFPDFALPNAQLLYPFVDEIELLCFESIEPSSLLSDSEIQGLARLRQDHGLTYNVHLPIDRNIADTDPSKREQDARFVADYARRLKPLCPVTYTLHIPRGTASLGQWLDSAKTGIETMICHGLEPGLVSVENLDYPLELLEPLLQEYGLGVCIDIGHLLEKRFDVAATLDRFSGRISIVHLYGGAVNGRHLSLEYLPDQTAALVAGFLSSFSGSVCLELFSVKDLAASMNRLCEMMSLFGD